MAEVTIKVEETNAKVPVTGAEISVDGASIGVTNQDGILVRDLEVGKHDFKAKAFNTAAEILQFDVSGDCQVTINIDLGASCKAYSDETKSTEIEYCTQGDVIYLEGSASQYSGSKFKYEWDLSGGLILDLDPEQSKVHWDTNDIQGRNKATVTITDISGTGASVSPYVEVNVRAASILQRTDSLPVSMRRAAPGTSLDQFLWPAIRNRTMAIRYDNYDDFITKVLCGKNIDAVKDSKTNTGMKASLKRQLDELYSPVHGVGSYELLKTATQIFLLLECGIDPEHLVEISVYNDEKRLYNPYEESSRLGKSMSFDQMKRGLSDYLGSGNLPYIERVLETAFGGYARVDSVFCNGYLGDRAGCPVLLELIWSYWHEEAMLVQSMNAISLRFQNRRRGSSRDPLAHLEIAPLYPINNLIFGYIQDEFFRTSVKRRAYEYDHHYGISPIGKAVGTVQPADSRSQFLEAFHNLLYRASLFYKQADDTTMIADGFPVLNALREVHLLLAHGAHNQYGDLPWMARAEMLMQQWILARPEMREFLQARAMVPYKEPWMPPVDTMKTMQGWTDVSVTHFHDLAEYGEQVLLSIRLGDWVAENDPLSAANWANYWRPEIQGYLHAYRVATGVDLTLEPREEQQAKLRATQPAFLLQRRMGAGTAEPFHAGKTPIAQPFRERREARRQ